MAKEAEDRRRTEALKKQKAAEEQQRIEAELRQKEA